MKKILIIILFLSIGIVSNGQDMHFSQFYNYPLALNPALTGQFKQDYRLSAIYRNQWRSINSSFTTMSFAGDINFRVNNLSHDRIGVGVFIYNDRMGEGIIQNNSAYGSVAYHKVLDSHKRHKLSIGIQGGYVRKTIDYSSLYFQSQIIDYEVDHSASTGENMDNNGFGYLNVNAGLGYSYRLTEHSELHAGSSFFNAINPKESFAKEFLAEDLNRLKNRALVNLGMQYRINEYISFLPEILLMYQQRATDLNMGAALGYHIGGFKGHTMVMAGAWYRIKDATIMMAGVQYRNYRFGFSYDATISPLNDLRDSPASRHNGRVNAYEISLTHVGFLNRPMPSNYTIPCGIF